MGDLGGEHREGGSAHRRVRRARRPSTTSSEAQGNLVYRVLEAMLEALDRNDLRARAQARRAGRADRPPVQAVLPGARAAPGRGRRSSGPVRWSWPSRYLERIADNAVDIGERISYMVTGDFGRHRRSGRGLSAGVSAIAERYAVRPQAGRGRGRLRRTRPARRHHRRGDQDRRAGRDPPGDRRRRAATSARTALRSSWPSRAVPRRALALHRHAADQQGAGWSSGKAFLIHSRGLAQAAPGDRPQGRLARGASSRSCSRST